MREMHKFPVSAACREGACLQCNDRDDEEVRFYEAGCPDVHVGACEVCQDLEFEETAELALRGPRD